MNLASHSSRLSRWLVVGQMTLGLTLGGLLWQQTAEAVPSPPGSYTFLPDSGLTGTFTVAPDGQSLSEWNIDTPLAPSNFVSPGTTQQNGPDSFSPTFTLPLPNGSDTWDLFVYWDLGLWQEFGTGVRGSCDATILGVCVGQVPVFLGSRSGPVLFQLVPPTTVPEPGALFTLLGGLVFLLGYRRRQQRHA